MHTLRKPGNAQFRMNIPADIVQKLFKRPYLVRIELITLRPVTMTEPQGKFPAAGQHQNGIRFGKDFVRLFPQ